MKHKKPVHQPPPPRHLAAAKPVEAETSSGPEIEISLSLPKLLSGKRGLFFLIFLIALLARLYFIPNPSFEADISFWKSWGLSTIDKGIIWTMHYTNNNYPTPFGYFLAIVVKAYSVFADPHNFDEYWNNQNLLFLTLMKIPPILADFGVAGIFLWIGRKARQFGFPEDSKNLFPWFAVIYLLSPLSIMDGSWWGQVDSLGVLIFLFSLVALLYKKPFLTGLLYMTALMTKLQTMIYGPLFFLFIWQQLGLKGLMKSILGAMVAFLGLNIEFFLAHDMGRVIDSLTGNYDYFPLMSLNAYNIWWIVDKANGMHVSDKLLSIGILNAKKVGIILFSGAYLLAVLHSLTGTVIAMWNHSLSWRAKLLMRKDKLAQNVSAVVADAVDSNHLFPFFVSLSLVTAAFFLFQTESHDRYAFPLSVFLLFVTPFLSKTRRKIWLVGYGLWTALYFFNLHSAFAANYPNNVFLWLGQFRTPGFTIAASYMSLAVFGTYLLFFRREIKWPVFLISLGFILLSIFGGNMGYIMGKPILLSQFLPVSHSQDWGVYAKNMSTNAAAGPKSWNPLSVQYVFYKYGLGTHANSNLEYDIGGKFTKLTTDYGIDTEAGPSGSSTFQVWGDGRLLWESEKMVRYQMPKHADVDLTGVKTLQLVTTDAGNGTQDDHTDWLNTKLWR